MKILLLSNTLNCGGAERQMVYLAKFLKRDGFSVEFVCCNLGEYYEDLLRQDGIKVNWIYAKLFNRGLSMRCRFFSFIFVLYAKLRIIWYIKKSKSSVVISFLELSNRLNCIAKLISNHTAITGERNAIMPLSSSASWIYYKLLMKLSDHIICNSFAGYNMWCTLAPTYKVKLSVIYNFIFKPKKTFLNNYVYKQDDKIHIVVPASYDNSRKNYLGLVKAVLLLSKEERKKLEVLWYGNLTDSHKCQASYLEAMKLINDNQLQNVISFRDKTKQIGDVMNAADFVALFSYVEGLPNAICEALALGKPIIMTRVSDYCSLVSDNGFLCETPEPLSIATSLKNAIKCDFSQIKSMSEKSFKIYEQIFSTEKSLNQWKQIILKQV